MNKHICFVVGLPGVGKTTFSRIYSEVSERKSINPGAILKEYLLNCGLNPSHREVGQLALQSLGETGIANLIMTEALRTESSIIDGVRLFSTYEYFVSAGFKVDVVMIVANESVRKLRLKVRHAKVCFSASKSETDYGDSGPLWLNDWKQFDNIKNYNFDNSGDVTRVFEYASSILKQ
jgi:dephospho-CoA kinase